MAIGTVYRAGIAPGPFHAIVIGSGLGGLTTAALLARAGRRVAVLERHYVDGGFTHVFRRPGFEWDVGVHYVGEVHLPRSALRQIFDHVSDGRLAWAPMDEVYDRVIVGERSFDLVAGRERFVEGLARHFPAQRAAIERYVERLRAVSRAARPFFAERALPPALGTLARPFMGRAFRREAALTTARAFSEMGVGPDLGGVLAAQFGDYGLPPGRSSFAIHALVANHYLDGGSYPVGGASSIAAGIVPGIEARGGVVLVSAEVERVLDDGRRACGVRLRGGEELRAPVIVSGAGVMTTFARLLDPGRHPWARERLRCVQPSVAHVCLYLGLRGSARELGLPRTNLWVYPGFDHDENVRRYLADPGQPLPMAYISFPSAKDPAWDARHPGSATIEVLGLAPWEWFERWQALPWRRRGPEYEALKEGFVRRLLEVLERQVPQVRGRIVCQELSTPLSTRHFANYERGEIYGLDHTPGRFALDWLRPHTPLPGLFLTGQDVVTDGLGGALMAGVLTASAVLRRNVMGEVLKAG